VFVELASGVLVVELCFFLLSDVFEVFGYDFVFVDLDFDVDVVERRFCFDEVVVDVCADRV